MRLKAMLLLPVVLSAGCSMAGPFVTNISSDGKGNLIVEKGYAVKDWWTGAMVNKEGGTSIIKITPEK